MVSPAVKEAQDRSAFPRIVRSLRGEVPQTQFAEALGVVHATVSYWENGVVWVTLESFVSLCRYAHAAGQTELVAELVRAVGAKGVLDVAA